MEKRNVKSKETQGGEPPRNPPEKPYVYYVARYDISYQNSYRTTNKEDYSRIVKDSMEWAKVHPMRYLFIVIDELDDKHNITSESRYVFEKTKNNDYMFRRLAR